MSKKKSKDAKAVKDKAAKTEADNRKGGDVVVAEQPEIVEPFESFVDWFDRWPAMFGRRFPDLHDLRLGPIDLFGGLETMRVEEYLDEDESETVIRVEVPGVDPDEDIDITIDSGRLTVEATREEHSTSESNGKRSEFRYGRFRRTMPVSSSVDADDVHATYNDGILEIRVPVDGDADEQRKIPITRASSK